VAALKRAEGALTAMSSSVRDAIARIDLPTIQVPEQLTKLGEVVTGRLPKPAEIIEANFELTTRLLSAQRDLALKLLEASEANPKS
jgi:hypothetical protein